MAHFNPEAEDAYFMDSADGMKMFDSNGNQVTEVSTGSSGAGINNRIFWNDNLADDYYDKSYLAVFNPETMQLDRQQVNGAWYTAGNLNNGTKNNPCVLGDLLGDWREEIVTWTESGGQYKLYICATNYTSNYRIPHLMDDFNYRAQVIAQNSVYNQPPHLIADPSVKYAGNPNQAKLEDEIDPSAIETLEAARQQRQQDVIYNLQGVRVEKITAPGLYINNGNKIMIK